MSRIEININPQVLRWAREEAGYEVSEISNKMAIGKEKYMLWETKGKNIPLGKLKILANTYKRQLAAFLLPTVPEKTTKPKDFRNLSPQKSKFSKRILEVIREVTYFRETAMEIQGEPYWKMRYEWLNKIETGKREYNKSIPRLRSLLNISLDDQLSWHADYEAYRKWRLAVEDRLGILVFQYPLPMDEAQGFCFTDKLPYAIVTNSNHSYTGRIFTIFHELAHVLRHQSGICLFEETTSKQKEEYACNEFAGKFLAPKEIIEPTDDLKIIAQNASMLKVSREVYLRRLREENEISKIKFYRLLEQIKSSYKERKKAAGFVTPEVRSRAKCGETFFNMVLDAMYREQISYTRASDTLSLNIPTLLNEF